jgi:CheY-like chemotaxis protein
MRKIAIVEDNPDNRLLVSALLEDRYELVEYEDGTSALEGITRSPPDLVLLDISLPGLDGGQVLAKLKASPGTARLPVIALTAHAMSGDRENMLAQGFDGYVSKPIVDETELFAAIAELLGAER